MGGRKTASKPDAVAVEGGWAVDKALGGPFAAGEVDVAALAAAKSKSSSKAESNVNCETCENCDEPDSLPRASSKSLTPAAVSGVVWGVSLDFEGSVTMADAFGVSKLGGAGG